VEDLGEVPPFDKLRARVSGSKFQVDFTWKLNIDHSLLDIF
jgi:hypothetical protein